MSNAGQRLVARLLLNLGQAEQRVETLRQVLSLLPTFTPSSTFLQLSPTPPLSPRDLLDFLDSLDLYATEQEAEMIIQQYDCDGDRCMSCVDFEQMTLPATSPSVRSIALSRSAGLYNAEVAAMLRQLITLELAYHRQLIADIREIWAVPDFDIRRVFDAMAVQRAITRESLKELGLRMGYKWEEETLDAVFRRLDWNGDELLSFEEFAAPFTYFQQTNSSNSLKNRSFSPLSTPKDTLCTSSSGLRLSARSLRGSIPLPTVTTPTFRPKSHLYRIPAPHLELILAYFSDKLAFLRQAELTRRQLSLDPGFSLEDSYHLFDPCDKGYLTARDLEEGIEALGVGIATGDAGLLLAEYATSAGRKISFSDFCDMILPFSAGRYGTSAAFSTNRPLKPPTSDYLSDLFRLLITTERRLEGHRQGLARLPSFSLSDLFKSLDIHQTSRLSLSDMRNFLEYHSIPTGESELTALLASLDRDKDGQVTMREFTEVLGPRSTH